MIQRMLVRGRGRTIFDCSGRAIERENQKLGVHIRSRLPPHGRAVAQRWYVPPHLREERRSARGHHHNTSRVHGGRENSHLELIDKIGKTYRATRCSATPGEHPCCLLRATQKRWKMWGGGKREGEEGEGKKKGKRDVKRKESNPSWCRTIN